MPTISARLRDAATAWADAVAVDTPRQRLTFTQLLERTRGQARGQAPSPAAGLLFDHDDADGLVAIYAVLAAGGWYTALSPSSPQVQNARVWSDIGARLLLTSEARRAQAVDIAGDERCVQTLPLDAVEFSRAGTEAPSGLAAVFYTSGSTGRPKGVMRSHAQILHRCDLNRRDLAYGPGDRIALTYGISYAASAAHVFGAILNGATLCPIDTAQLTSPDLVRVLRDSAISVWAPPVAQFRRVLADLDGGVELPALRQIELGGDALLRDDVVAFRRLFPATCRIVHRYSASEAGVATHAVIDRDSPLPSHRADVGRPVGDCEIAIRDEDGRPAPAGTEGRVVISSRYLSPGYWNDADATSRAFEIDPDVDGCRRFLSDDIGRLLPDGRLELLGRAGTLTKIRGFRVDVGEIEVALRSIAGVREAVVCVRTAADGDTMLAAFVTAVSPGGAGDLDVRAIRASLAERLPPHMVPARIIALGELPLTPTGKPDRQALANQPLPEPVVPQRYVAPEDDLERTVAGIWREALKVDRVGTSDHFFELGGDSLTAMAVMLRLTRATGHSLPLTALYEVPTVAGLATRIRAGGQAAMPSPLVTLQPLGDGTPLFIVPELEASAVNVMKITRRLGLAHPAYALQPRGFNDGTPPYTSIRDTARAYLRAIAAAGLDRPTMLAGICHGGLIAFEMAQQLHRMGRRVTTLALVDVTSLNNARAPMAARHARRQELEQKRRLLYRERALGRGGTARLRYAQKLAHLNYWAEPYDGRASLLQSSEFAGRGYADDWIGAVPRGLDITVVPQTTHPLLLTTPGPLRAIADWLLERMRGGNGA